MTFLWVYSWDILIHELKAADNWIAYQDENDMPPSVLTNNIGDDFGIKVKGPLLVL